MLLVPLSRSLTPIHHTNPPLRLPRSRSKLRWGHPRVLCATQPRREGSGKLQGAMNSSFWLLAAYDNVRYAPRGHQVMTVCPRYVPYDDIYDSGYLIPVELSDENLPKVSRLYMTHRKGVDHVFVDHLAFQGNEDSDTPSGGKNSRKEDIYPYWWGNEADFETSYSILCQVALAAPCVIWREDFANYETLPDGEDTDDGGLIFVANDWPCGILPVWMENYKAKADQAETISFEENSSHDPLKRSSSSHPDNGQAQDNSNDKGLLDHKATPVSFVSTMADVPESPPGAFWEQHIMDGTLNMKEKRIVGARTEMEKTISTKVELFQGDEKGDIDSSIISQAPRIEGKEALLPEKKSIPKHSQSGMNVGRRGSVQAGRESQLWDFQSWVGKRLTNSKIAFAIHNMAYQGRSFLESLRKIGCPGALGWKFAQKSYKHANWLKIGVTWSDAVLTVSPGYALELVRGGLEASGVWNALQKIGVKGIRNGIDINVWDPQKDRHLPQNLRYSINDVERGKHRAKIALQEKLGLEVSQSTSLFGFIGRLDHQKGVDIVLSAAPSLLRGPSLPKPIKLEDGLEGIVEEGQADQLQLVMLGSGDKWLEEGIKSLQYAFPGFAAGVAGFNEELAHQMLAGCDYLLVPSRFEPCGLVALCAARYGCIPIVAPVGGLNDLVRVENIGYALDKAPDKVPLKSAVSDMICCISRASSKYGSTEFEAMRKKCMALDVSWENPAVEWEEVLEGLHDGN